MTARIKPPQPQHLRAYGYVRVSTDEQARSGVSLQAQEAKIRSYASLHDLNLLEVFVDEGVSGKNTDRPALQKLLNAIQGPEEEAVIVWSLDRLSRRTRDLLWLIEDVFMQGGTRLISLSEQIDTSTAMGKFFLTIMGALSQMERELIAERTRTALDFKRQRGDRLGTTPLGFVTQPDGSLSAVQEELAVVRRIKALRSRGHSYWTIAARLNQEGVATKRGGTWHASTIRYVALNGRYGRPSKVASASQTQD
jgi:site-specific DNA recombinase